MEMQTTEQTVLLDRLEAETRSLLEFVRTHYLKAEPATLESRPADDAWNLLEKFAHVNIFFDLYLPRLELAIHKSRARQWAAGDRVKYNGRGKRALRRVAPDNPKKYKTKKRYNFIGQNIPPSVVKAFIINLEMLLRAIQNARSVDLNKTRIRKANSWFGKYYLGNLLEYLLLHSQRHVQ